MRGTPQGQKSAGLHQPAGHMTASDPRTAPHDLLRGGGHSQMRRRDFFPLVDDGLIGGRCLVRGGAATCNIFGVPPT